MGFNRVPLILALLIFVPFFCISQDTIRIDTLIKRAHLVEDDPVINMLDSLANLRVFEDAEFPNSNQYQNWATYTDTDVPSFPDSVYFERIAQMNEQSPFEYVYNREVKQFIDLYAVKKRKLTARILGLSQIYFPLFEEQLDKYNMPLELKYLAVIESALNPVATSRVGARGLWQFMYGTGKVYGLKVSSYVDDRYDPYKATIAACEHLNDLYDIYGNWSLALAAYNSGAGNVNKAIRRAGGVKNFWLLQRYLPRETRSYVPAFIAASYVLTHANEHKIYPVDPGILYYEVDTVTVCRPLSFEQISEMLNIPLEEIQFLNPSFKQDFIPATVETPYKVRLRKKFVGSFINNEQALYAYKTKSWSAQDSLMKLIYNNYRETELYTVKSGETMASIAKKYKMSVSELKNLNGLRSNTLKPKKKILVYSKPKKEPAIEKELASTYVPAPARKDTTANPGQSDSAAMTENKTASVASKQTGSTTNNTTVHYIKSGETLGSVASHYHCTVNDLMQWNHLSTTNIKTGQKLVIGGALASASTPSKPSASVDKKTKPAPQPSGTKYITYTIQSGDNLWDIAVKFDITVSQIKTLNGLKNAHRLKPGQKIKIPK